jgi:polysaccharide deacetylase 2 family uncharacterized protein YibQ
VTLQLLGPLPAPPPHVTASTPPAPAQPPAAVQPPVPPAPPKQAAAPAPPRPGRDTPGPIPDPDPALQEPVPGNMSDLVPQIAGDGRMPMQIYAAGFDASTRRPRVGLLLAGVGLNQADSEAAIRTLPGGITLAFSPYAAEPAKLLAAARMAEHEYLLSIPMEPQGFPLNDPGSKALMTSLPPEQNHQRLEWVLSRIAGYAGVTGALGSLRGERFASLPEQMNPMLEEFARRGLLYVDARQGAPAAPFVWGRAIDLVIDEPPDAADIDDKLGRLARLARDKGSALGLVTVVRPVTTARIAAWSNGLAGDGLALAPVSALVRPPLATKSAQ